MQTQDLQVGVKVTLSPAEMQIALQGEIDGAKFESWLWLDSDYMRHFYLYDESSFLITIDNTPQARAWLNSRVQHFISSAQF